MTMLDSEPDEFDLPDDMELSDDNDSSSVSTKSSSRCNKLRDIERLLEEKALSKQIEDDYWMDDDDL